MQLRAEASEELRRAREETTRILAQAHTESERLRSDAAAVLEQARAEAESLRSQRDEIATELTHLSGVIEALAVSDVTATRSHAPGVAR